jgi:phenylalanyl-tRNA synthetase beta chain
MGYGLKGTKVLVPAYRADVLHPYDLIEDIAIAYGYDHITAEIPHVATIAEESPLARFVSKLRELLIGYQFQEICSYHLISHDEATHMMNSKEQVVHLANALVDYNCLRNSILPSLLKVLRENQHN